MKTSNKYSPEVKGLRFALARNRRLLVPAGRIEGWPRSRHSRSRTQPEPRRISAGHLDEDIAFLQAVRATPGPMRSGMQGEQAIVESASDIKATSNGKTANFRTLETLTLTKQSAGWLIDTIHWWLDPTSQATGLQDTK